MEENEVLDAAYKKKVNSKQYLVNSLKKKALYFFIYSLFTIHYSLLSSCSLPRIIVLEDPLSPEEHINLGVAYEKKGELDNALKEYKEASKKLPAAYLYIGNIYFQEKRFDEAELYYKKAIKKDSQNAAAYNNLAWLYYTKKENLDDAVTLVLKAMELNPSRKDVYQDTLEKIRKLKNY
ncbi:MAG: tetratricopeptide repeat protein [Nitrospirae bacterium]|nr:tetratricopeptide repeat protein [Nitrospirota bacterium]